MKHDMTAVKENAPTPTASDGATVLSMIDRMATLPEIDMDRVERMFALYQQMQEKAAQQAYAAALAQMQAEIPAIPENGKIVVRGAVQSTYALWEDVVQVCRPIMARHGFALHFKTAQDSGQITVTAILAHEGGHSESASLTLPHDTSGSKNPVQAMASSLSYGKRYAAGELLNIVSRGDDDDGQAAGAAPTITAQQRMNIVDLLNQSNSDTKAFLAYGGYASLDDMPASHYDDAVRILRAKVAKAEGSQ